MTTRWRRPLTVAAVGLLFAVGCTSDDGDVFDLAVGDCFDDPEDPVSQVAEVPIVSCDEPHDNEVFAIFELTNGDYPGDAEVNVRAQEGCLARFDDYVGVDYAVSELFASWLYPTEGSWGEGDQEVVCVLFAPDGPLEGSQEGAAR